MNTSGIKPVNCNVLVLQDKAEEKKGSIILPDSIKEKDQHAQTAGVLVAMAPDAFMDEWGKNAYGVEVGNRVTFGRYTGKPITGKDGTEYLLIKDKDITGVEA